MSHRPLLDAARSGDRVRTLEALRDLLAEDLAAAHTPPRDRAALARQLTSVLRELEEVAPPKEATPLDELTRRRRARAASL